MKLAIFCILVVATANGASAGRKIMQTTLPLPTLAPPPPAGVTPAPAPGQANTCALEYLVNAGNYNTLIELVEAASQSTQIAQILDSPSSTVTLLAPTDAGVQTALQTLGLTVDQVLANPARITDILLYHVLPSQIQASDLVNGYAFNTQLTQNGVAQSIGIQGGGASSTFVGKSSTAAGTGTIASACNIAIIPINGLLVP